MRWTAGQYQEYLETGTKSKSKYRNRKTVVDNIQFDSQKEANFYCELKLLKKAGDIKDFGLQEKFELQPGFQKNGKKHRPITYLADFVITYHDGTTEVVDVKASEKFQTDVYKIKKKLFEYKYPGLSIKEVY